MGNDNTLPPLNKVEEGGSMRMLIFSEAFETDSLLFHTSKYLSNVFDEEFFFSKSETSAGFKEILERDGLSEMYVIENRKDRKNENGVYEDGAGFSLCIDGKKKKCSFSLEYLRWDKMKQICDFDETDPLYIAKNSSKISDAVRKLEFGNYVLSFENGENALKQYLKTERRWK